MKSGHAQPPLRGAGGTNLASTSGSCPSAAVLSASATFLTSAPHTLFPPFALMLHTLQNPFPRNPCEYRLFRAMLSDNQTRHPSAPAHALAFYIHLPASGSILPALRPLPKVELPSPKAEIASPKAELSSPKVELSAPCPLPDPVPGPARNILNSSPMHETTRPPQIRSLGLRPPAATAQSNRGPMTKNGYAPRRPPSHIRPGSVLVARKPITFIPSQDRVPYRSPNVRLSDRSKIIPPLLDPPRRRSPLALDLNSAKKSRSYSRPDPRRSGPKRARKNPVRSQPGRLPRRALADARELPPLARLVHTLLKEKIRFQVAGMSAAILQGVPATTLDTHLWIDLPARQYIRVIRICRQLGATVLANTVVELSDGSLVNFLYEVHGLEDFGREFMSARRLDWLGSRVAVLPLERIRESKRFVGRPKDLAHLPLLDRTIALHRRLKSSARRAKPKTGPRIRL